MPSGARAIELSVAPRHVCYRALSASGQRKTAVVQFMSPATDGKFFVGYLTGTSIDKPMLLTNLAVKGTPDVAVQRTLGKKQRTVSPLDLGLAVEFGLRRFQDTTEDQKEADRVAKEVRVKLAQARPLAQMYYAAMRKALADGKLAGAQQTALLSAAKEAAKVREIHRELRALTGTGSKKEFFSRGDPGRLDVVRLDLQWGEGDRAVTEDEEDKSGAGLLSNLDDDDAGGKPDRDQRGPQAFEDDDLVRVQVPFATTDETIKGKLKLSLLPAGGIRLHTDRKKSATLSMPLSLDLPDLVLKAELGGGFAGDRRFYAEGDVQPFPGTRTRTRRTLRLALEDTSGKPDRLGCQDEVKVELFALLGPQYVPEFATQVYQVQPKTAGRLVVSVIDGRATPIQNKFAWRVHFGRGPRQVRLVFQSGRVRVDRQVDLFGIEVRQPTAAEMQGVVTGVPSPGGATFRGRTQNHMEVTASQPGFVQIRQGLGGPIVMGRQLRPTRLYRVTLNNWPGIWLPARITVSSPTASHRGIDRLEIGFLNQVQVTTWEGVFARRLAARRLIRVTATEDGGEIPFDTWIPDAVLRRHRQPFYATDRNSTGMFFRPAAGNRSATLVFRDSPFAPMAQVGTFRVAGGTRTLHQIEARIVWNYQSYVIAQTKEQRVDPINRTTVLLSARVRARWRYRAHARAAAPEMAPQLLRVGSDYAALDNAWQEVSDGRDPQLVASGTLFNTRLGKGLFLIQP